MTIHARIKAARTAQGWSMQQLAAEVTQAEGLAKPLTWQAVQQWENGKSAPSRKRLALVASLLNTTTAALLGDDAEEVAVAPAGIDLTPEIVQLLADLQDIPPARRSRLLDQIHQVAEESREAVAHFAAREQKQKPVASAAARSGSTRFRATLTYGDGNRRQHALPFDMVADPFTAEPNEREAAWYRHIEGTPRSTK